MTSFTRAIATTCLLALTSAVLPAQPVASPPARGVRIETMETPGGHEWANWRLYLHEIAPTLFR